MIKEYALEYLDRIVNSKHRTEEDRPSLYFSVIKDFSCEPEFLSLAESYSDEKILSICKTIRNISRYEKVTEKQRFSLARFLMDKNNDCAETVINKAFENKDLETKKVNQINNFLKTCGYEAEDLLMDPENKVVDVFERWAIEAKTWGDDCITRFQKLIKVKK